MLGDRGLRHQLLVGFISDPDNLSAGEVDNRASIGMGRRQIVEQLLRVCLANGECRFDIRFPVNCGVDTLVADG